MLGRMKASRHTERSRQIGQVLETWGFSQEVRQRVGALAVLWGAFESNLETALWALRGELVAGVRPSTDKTSVGNWVQELGYIWPNMTQDANDVLRAASLAAADLMAYRHAIMHGAMIPDAAMPSFIRNPSWHQEVRARPSHSAHVSENLLDMAIDAAWVLCEVVFAARAACSDSEKAARVTALKKEVERAGRSAGELRHLDELMNHEKYGSYSALC